MTPGETVFVRFSAKSMFAGLGGPAKEGPSETTAGAPTAAEASLPMPNAPAPDPEPTATDPGAPPRVLLAEDHPVNRKVVELILGAINASITVAENGAEAVEAFRADRFDVILMDMQMPVMDGLAATRAIRAMEAEGGLPRTPIFSLTANAMPEHVQASHDAGADDHLTKPVSAAGLIAAVRSAQVGRKVAEQPLRRAG